ncbi:Uncharacterised protein [Mycobacteroides abscessus subsp. abscessus]|nr:Uncharacterised protein [Mycobacteroides abscessus subsp. abscessus]
MSFTANPSNNNAGNTERATSLRRSTLRLGPSLKNRCTKTRIDRGFTPASPS